MQARPLLATGTLAKLQKASSRRPGLRCCSDKFIWVGWIYWDTSVVTANSERFTKEPISFTDTEQLYAILVIAMARVPSMQLLAQKWLKAKKTWLQKKKKRASIKKRKTASVWKPIWLECFLSAITRNTQEYDFNPKKDNHVSSQANVIHNHIFNSPQDMSQQQK